MILGELLLFVIYDAKSRRGGNIILLQLTHDTQKRMCAKTDYDQ